MGQDEEQQVHIMKLAEFAASVLGAEDKTVGKLIGPSADVEVVPCKACGVMTRRQHRNADECINALVAFVEGYVKGRKSDG